MTTRLAFYHPWNPKNRKDGGEFDVCARRWAGGMTLGERQWAGGVVYQVDNAEMIRSRLKSAVFQGQQRDQIGFFCHGFPNRLSIWAPTLAVDSNARQLAYALRPVLAPGGAVALYACKTDTGTTATDQFAELLSAALPGSPVFAHTTSGHTTENPYAILLRGGKRIYRHPDDPGLTRGDVSVRWGKWKAYVKLHWQDLCTVEGWKAAEAALGLKLEVG